MNSLLFNNPFFKNNPHYISINNILRTGYNLKFLAPNFCPFDNRASNFSYVTKTFVCDNHVGIIFQCPSCQRYCVIDYRIILNHNTIPGKYETRIIDYDYNFIHPTLLFKKKDLDVLSSIRLNKNDDFKRIYLQAAKADYMGLNDIAVMGYRKALECLVTGYLIHFADCTIDKIKHNSLSNDINMVKNADLKNCARIASWAGNNGTHMFKRDPDLTPKVLRQNIKVAGLMVLSKIVAKRARKRIKEDKN